MSVCVCVPVGVCVSVCRRESERDREGNEEEKEKMLCMHICLLMYVCGPFSLPGLLWIENILSSLFCRGSFKLPDLLTVS